MPLHLDAEKLRELYDTGEEQDLEDIFLAPSRRQIRYLHHLCSQLPDSVSEPLLAHAKNGDSHRYRVLIINALTVARRIREASCCTD